MKLLNFNIIKLTLCLSIGIFIANYASINWLTLLYIVLALTSLLALFHAIYIKRYKYSLVFSGITYCIFVTFGISTVKLHEQSQWKHHYLSEISKDEITHAATFKVQTVLKPSAYHDKYIVSILNLSNKQSTGKILLNVNKDSLVSVLTVDAIYTAKFQLKNITTPKNPYQFDYASYLKRHYVYKQTSLAYNELFLINKQPHTLKGYAARFRHQIKENLKFYGFKGDVLAVTEGLFLGQRQSINQTTYQNYINAGAVHILAISGLHVGIVLGILNYLFLPLSYFKYGRYIKLILILILLWSFAMISGLSASVTRAVTMFSIVSIAMHIKRPSNIYNTLVISMFIILLFKPLFLFDVGFQLSYTAVLSIVWIKPLLDSWWAPKPKVLKFIWDIFTVSLAAQIGVTPISLFYFHQFPGLFFISNLVIIPLLGIILTLGFFVLTLALFKLLPEFLASLFSYTIETLNNFVAWIADKEHYLITDIAFDLKLLIPLYLLLIATVLCLKQFSAKRLYAVIIAIALVQSIFILKRFTQPKAQFIIFNKSRFTLIGTHQRKSLMVNHNLDSTARLRDNTITSYKVAKYIKHVQEDSIKDFYIFNNKIIYVVDSLGVYNLKSEKPYYVLLCNSPKINLNRMIDSLQPKYIIADASNYTSYVKRWEATCAKRKLPFHYTREKGAFILK